jgi:hypothetical protein
LLQSPIRIVATPAARQVAATVAAKGCPFPSSPGMPAKVRITGFTAMM